MNTELLRMLLLLLVLLLVFYIAAVVVLGSVSFEPATCSGWSLSCLDLWVSCVGRYVCADDACVAMSCIGPEQAETRHGGGLLFLFAALLAMAFVVVVGRGHPECEKGTK